MEQARNTRDVHQGVVSLVARPYVTTNIPTP
jgi:hypothetical protein